MTCGNAGGAVCGWLSWQISAGERSSQRRGATGASAVTCSIVVARCLAKGLAELVSSDTSSASRRRGVAVLIAGRMTMVDLTCRVG